MKKAIYENDMIYTKDKPYSACWMVFGPKSNCNIIIGKTADIKKYWESFEMSFSFQWFIFDTEEQMNVAVEKMVSEPTPYVTWMIYRVEDCINNTNPDPDTGVNRGNTRDEMFLFKRIDGEGED
ncbi:hypothetical protein CEQ21_02565 [Niallia circulans]|uniref:Uncharacterized protein n=1 Tax=Niallia circulans TaxID=1397 RepID=A0A553SSA1_NIACI|nr:hypothetical protein [Niallia circulans]TRZ39848.1 hypothetical protein CEQ21_02565 [Niallia circulans]